MTQVVIENPIINSPFDEPARHFRFTDEGITNEEVDGRRTSSYFVPIAKPKKKGARQLHIDTESTLDRIDENKLVNDIRCRVAMWRKGGYVGVRPTTARLIACWTDPRREKKLFFYQNEALETAIYITEVARNYGDTWIENTHIRLQFLGEAVAMSFIGSLAGFFLALLLSHWIGSIPFLRQLFEDESKLGDIHLRVNAQAFLVSFATLSLVGLLSGLWPAIKTSRLDPVEALRYE